MKFPGVVYVQDDDEMIADFEDDPEIRALYAEWATDGLDAAKSIAGSITKSGDYLNSLTAVGARLATDDRAGHIIEWGSVDTPPHGVLRKAVEQVGATYVDDGPNA